ADAAVIGFEIDHASIQSPEQVGMVEQDVRALCPPDQPRGRAKRLVHPVDPWAGGIDDYSRPEASFASVREREMDSACLGPSQRCIVQRLRVRARLDSVV